MRLNEAGLSQTADHHLTIHVAHFTVLNEGHGAQLVELNLAVVLGHDAGVGGCVGSHTTGVERTERQLCTRLTDSLSGNHTDSLTLLNHTTGSQVTAVTLHADTLLRLTGEHRTDLDTFDIGLLDGLSQRLGNLLTGRHDHLASLGINHIMYRHTAKDTL